MFSVTVCKVLFVYFKFKKEQSNVVCWSGTHVTKVCYVCDSGLRSHFMIKKWIKRLVLLAHWMLNFYKNT